MSKKLSTKLSPSYLHDWGSWYLCSANMEHIVVEDVWPLLYWIPWEPLLSPIDEFCCAYSWGLKATAQYRHFCWRISLNHYHGCPRMAASARWLHCRFFLFYYSFMFPLPHFWRKGASILPGDCFQLQVSIWLPKSHGFWVDSIIEYGNTRTKCQYVHKMTILSRLIDSRSILYSNSHMKCQYVALLSSDS